eukprot:2320326-Ditylum_brightwellii.AAC.1
MIRQHFTWNNLRKDVEQVCKRCVTCHLTKKLDPEIGNIPAKIVEEERKGKHKNGKKKRPHIVVCHHDRPSNIM